MCGRPHLKIEERPLPLVRKMSALDNPLNADVCYGQPLKLKVRLTID